MRVVSQALIAGDVKRSTIGLAFKIAFFVHCLATPAVYLLLSDQQQISNTGLVAGFLSVSSSVFGAVSHVALCKSASTLSTILISVGAWTAQAYLILRLIFFCSKPLDDEPPFTTSDRVRFVVIAAFGAYMHAYTFWLMGDATSTPGYNVLCLAPNKMWWIWTVQTLVIAYFVSLCIGSALGAVRIELRALKMKKGK